MEMPLRAETVDRQASMRLLDVLIRAGLIAAMTAVCYLVFSPFLTLMLWAVILAVAFYPLHQALARSVGGRRGLASCILVMATIVVILAPTAVLMNSLGDSVRGGIDAIQRDAVTVPPPREQVKRWPVVGDRIYGVWKRAHEDLPGLVHSLQPKIGELSRKALSTVASIGAGLLMFLASLIIAGIIMAYGEAGARTSRAIFTRIAGPVRGEQMTTLSTATIRTVAQGVLGVAFIQALAFGLVLVIAGVPWAGLLSLGVLILAIAQVPTLLIGLPAIAYLWSSGHYATTAAVVYTLLLLLVSLIDNVLKPLMLGRGVDAPMPVILLGALGGMASDGILGMFVGATLLALGYQIFMGWVMTPEPDEVPVAAAASPPSR